jgi:hypothetical protein
MSYCRFNGEDSEVYVIAHVDGTITCYCGQETGWKGNRQQAIDHLLEHRQNGYKVPDRAIDRLNREIAEEEL